MSTDEKTLPPEFTTPPDPREAIRLAAETQYLLAGVFAPHPPLLSVCRPDAKFPPFKRWQKRGAGSLEELEALMLQYPRATMLGSLTGGPSGWWCSDVDRKHGGDRALAELEERFGPISEDRFLTPGGLRLAHKWTPRLRIATTAGQIAEGIDQRGGTDDRCTGFTVIPPSVRADGGVYQYPTKSGGGSLCCLTEPPLGYLWLAAFNRKQRERLAALGIQGPSDLDGQPPPSQWQELALEALRPKRASSPPRPKGEMNEDLRRALERYVEGGIADELKNVREAEDGHRDTVLWKACCSIQELVQGIDAEGVGAPEFEEQTFDRLVKAAGVHGPEFGEELVEEKWNRARQHVGPRDLSDVKLPDAGAEFGDLRRRRVLSPGDPLPSAAAMIEDKFTEGGLRTLHYVGGEFLKFTGTHYEAMSDKDINAEVWNYLGGCYRPNGEKEPLPFAPTTNKVRDVLNALHATCRLGGHHRPPAWLPGAPDSAPPPDEVVPCANGLLHVPTRKLLPHTPAFLGVNVRPYAYDRGATAERWLAFLKSLWTDESGRVDAEAIETLQAWFGYCLTLDTRLQKIMVFHGVSRGGKGLTNRILQAVIGEENCTNPSMGDLSGRFGLQPLIGKQLATVSDARLGAKSNKPALLENLLRVSGEDFVTADRKGVTTWEGRLTTRFLIISNAVPDLPDAAEAFVNRCIVLPFVKTFKHAEDHDLEGRLRGELPGILNWALAGLERLQRGGDFKQPEFGEAHERGHGPLCEPGAGLRRRGVRRRMGWAGRMHGLVHALQRLVPYEWAVCPEQRPVRRTAAVGGARAPQSQAPVRHRAAARVQVRGH